MTSKKLKFNKYWFKPRRFGLGATPTTWEGWLVILFFFMWLAYLTTNFISDPYVFVPSMIMGIVILTYVSRIKTDGKWKWSWG